MGPERGQVRVLSPDGSLWGAGVLVVPAGNTAHVLTCAHVVAAATAASVGKLVVDLPGHDWSAPVDLLPGVLSSAPPLTPTTPGPGSTANADFAVLTLGAGHPRLPHGRGPLPVLPCGPPDGRRVMVLGYPRGAPAGLIATARLTGRGGPCPDWIQLDALRTTGAAVERGFSGAAVWDPDRRRVIGLITAAHTDRAVRTAWMLPVEVALRLWPPLSGALRPADPPPCVPPSVQQQYELADALLDVPQIGHDSGRTLREALPAAVRRNVRDHAWPRQQLQAIVHACTDQRGGCAALRAAVLDLGGGSVSAQTAADLLDRTCCSSEPPPEGV